ncbi:aspartyl/asparaginyl beta-hydroxylase domain-containing protein [Lentisalinibacter orientalis]|uniref:aspartyl/asparaginyl beta-hydroxylase domain-containing protein n=1 Tax=Lentisalinibacter orientalis TaxID=2992241 RepID=UPI00386DFE0C
MKIDQPLKELGDVDVEPLRDAILGQDDSAWNEQEYRQQEYEVHKRTTSIVMIFTDGKNWPEITVRKEPGWDRLADAALPLMQDIIARYYPPGGTIIRAMAARLAAGARIDPHRDSHPSFHASHRIHIPVTTNPRVRFMIDGRPHRLEVGKVYELNNQLLHSVMNKGDEDRVTFIFDYLPPGAVRAA